MPGPNYYDNQSKELIDIVKRNEETLLVNVSKKFKANDPVFIAIKNGEDVSIIADWRLRKLEQLGALTESNIKVIAKSANKQIKEIEEVIEQTTLTLLSDGESQLMKAAKAGFLNQGVPELADSTVVQRTIKNFQRLTKESFNQLNTSMVGSAGNSYRTIVNQVTAEVIGGISTPNQALKKFTNELGAKGLTGFVDKGGRNWTPEAYGKMIIRSNIKESAKQSTFERAQEYGNNHIEISSHSDARPKCAVDQGKVYSLLGNTKPIEDLNGNIIEVFDFNDTSNGEPDGILGINCTHQVYNFVPGFSTKTYENTDELGPERVDEDYKERERQRVIERNIRSYKTRKEMFLSQNDAFNAQRMQSGVSRWQHEMRTFIDKTGRVRNSANEQI